MLFTFKRDDEGRERIYCGEVHLANLKSDAVGKWWEYVGHVDGADECIGEAVERADAAGFWRLHEVPAALIDTNGQRHDGAAWTRYGVEVTVDVPIAETTVLSVTLEGEDQS